MTKIFGSLYADIYDSVYRGKNYEDECNLLHKLFNNFKEGNITSVLDLGCGTGNHSIHLAAKGYEVSGVDRSDEMLDLARLKAKERDLPVNFYCGDIKTIDLGKKFDAVIVMFAVLGYQSTNEDVIQTLKNIRRHLRAGGLLIFDVWYGPAVLSQKPGDRVSIVEDNNLKIIRLSSGVLDTFRHICNVTYNVYKIEGKEVVDETVEVHQMRFFFPQELRFFLNITGFEIVHIGPFPEYEEELGDGTWNALVVARGI